MELIDTHQHLILRDRLGYAWADAIPALVGRDFTAADYARLTEGAVAANSITQSRAESPPPKITRRLLR